IKPTSDPLQTFSSRATATRGGETLVLPTDWSGVRWWLSDLFDGVPGTSCLGYGGAFDAGDGEPSHCIAKSTPADEVPVSMSGSEQHRFNIPGRRAAILVRVSQSRYSLLGHCFFQGRSDH